MKAVNFSVAIALAVLCSACASTARRQPEDPAAIAAQDDARCKENHHTPGTQDYDDCRKTMERNRASVDATSAQRLQRTREHLIEGDSMLSPHQTF